MQSRHRRRTALGRTASGFAGLLVVAVLGGCSTAYSFNTVEIARTALIGFDEDDVRMCAGFPTRTSEDGRISIWSYETSSRSGGINISAPIFLGAASTALNLQNGGTCRVQMRFVNGRVDRLSYAGDNNTPQGRNTLCTPVVEECVAYARRFGKASASTLRAAAASAAKEPEAAEAGGTR